MRAEPGLHIIVGLLWLATWFFLHRSLVVQPIEGCLYRHGNY